jgi:Protein of unknown function (DUF3277)
MGQSTTYSFLDLSGGFSHTYSDYYTFSGNSQGKGQIVVTMATEKTVHSVSADGTTMPSYVAGDNGTISIECQQTSDLHKYLLGWYNNLQDAAKNGDVSEWATASLMLRNVTDGTSHYCDGISPQNVPPKTYGAQGGNVTWVLMCCDIQNPTS